MLQQGEQIQPVVTQGQLDAMPDTCRMRLVRLVDISEKSPSGKSSFFLTQPACVGRVVGQEEACNETNGNGDCPFDDLEDVSSMNSHWKFLTYE